MTKPKGVRFKQPVRGFHIGGCVTGEALPDDVAAHAHLRGSEPKWAIGYICAGTRRELVGTLLHELAHLIANDGHGEPWRREMRRLGARIPARHRLKPRSDGSR